MWKQDSAVYDFFPGRLFFFFIEEMMTFFRIIILNKQNGKNSVLSSVYRRAMQHLSAMHTLVVHAVIMPFSSEVGREHSQSWLWLLVMLIIKAILCGLTLCSYSSHAGAPFMITLSVYGGSKSHNKVQGTKDMLPSQFSKTVDFQEETARPCTQARACYLFPSKVSRGHVTTSLQFFLHEVFHLFR